MTPLTTRCSRIATTICSAWERRGIKLDHQLMTDAVSDAFASQPPVEGEHIFIPKQILDDIREALSWLRDEIRQDPDVAAAFSPDGATRPMKVLRWLNEHATS